MFDCQRQLLSFLYLGEVMTTVLRSPGRRSKKLSLKRAPCKGISIKTSFARAGENNVSSHMPSFCFILQRKRLFRGRSRSFVFLKKYTVSARVFPALSFSVSCMKQRCCSSGDSQVSGFIRYTHWEVLAGTVNVLSCIGLPCFFPSKSVTFISNIGGLWCPDSRKSVDIEAVVLPDRIDEDWSKDSFGLVMQGFPVTVIVDARPGYYR